MANITGEVAATVEAHPERLAVAYDDHEVDYQTLWGQVGAFASGLAEAGVGPDDRVALYLPNLPQFVVGFHGTLRAGGAVVPMNPQYKAREIEHLLSDSEATVVVALADLVPFVEEVQDDTHVETIVTVGGETETGVDFESFLGDPNFETVARDDDDVACQPYTSGTTGQPKGVLLSHENLRSNAAVAQTLAPGEGIRPDDRMLGVLPLFHIYGMTVTMNSVLFAGGTYMPLPSWDVQQAVDVIESAGVSVFHGVPAMYNDIVGNDAGEADLSGLRLCGVGGSGIPEEVLRGFEELYDAEIYEGYGLTETSPVTHFNTPDAGRRVGSIGKLLPDIDARVVDDGFEPVAPVETGPVEEDETDLDEITGELVVTGPNVCLGYHDRPGANEASFTDHDGRRWFHTGDIAYHDEDGFFYVVDREKHVIVTGGYNVYPREVEELLFEHDAVADAAVVGVSDDRRGETVQAFVVPTAGTEATPEELKQYCLDSLAEYKHPREVSFVEELPRTTTGKVQKFELVGESA